MEKQKLFGHFIVTPFFGIDFGRFGGPILHPSWGDLGVVLGSSWGGLGGSSGHLGVVLGDLGVVLADLGVILGWGGTRDGRDGMFWVNHRVISNSGNPVGNPKHI